MFSLLRRTNWRSALDLLQTESARPVYVINLIRYRNFSAYRWYGLFVYPLVRLLGGMPVWVGRHVQSIGGEARFGNLLIVRYPSHRRFLAMILNPYYTIINDLREAGVERFEAAFSRAHGRNAPAHIHARYLVGLHGNPETRRDLDRLGAELRGAGLEQVIELREYAPLPATEPVLPSDPQPHTYKYNLFFRVDDPAQIEPLAERLRERAGECAVHLYRAVPRREYLPGMPLPEATEVPRPAGQTSV